MRSAVFKDILKDVAKQARDLLLQDVNNSMSRDLLFCTLARCVWYGDYKLASFLIRTHADAAAFLGISGGKVFFWDPQGFSEAFERCRVKGFDVCISDLASQLRDDVDEESKTLNSFSSSSAKRSLKPRSTTIIDAGRCGSQLASLLISRA